MKCYNCKAEWNVSAAMSASIQICPFCGVDLVLKPDNEIRSLQDVLRAIIAHGGLNTLRNGKRSLAMFSDLAPNLRKEKTMFSYLVQVEGNKVLFDALHESKSEQLILRRRIVQNMVETFLVTETIAFTACDSFWEVIGGEPFEQKCDVSVPKEPADTTIASSSRTKQVTQIIASQDISDSKESQYQNALTLYNVALTKEDFQKVESAFRSLGSYSNAAEMVTQISNEWAIRSKRAQELYQAYQLGSTGKDPVATVDRDIAALQAQKENCERIQNSVPMLKAELEEYRRKRNAASSEVTSLKQKITELESQRPKFMFWGGKEYAARIEALQKQLRGREDEYRINCQQVASIQDAINSIPAPYQTRAKIQKIEEQISRKYAERNIVCQRAYAGLSNFVEVKKQICELKYLAILSKEPVKAMVLKKDPMISTAMVQLIKMPNNGTSAMPINPSQSLEDMLRTVQNNGKVTEAERLRIFQKGKQLLTNGDKIQAIKLIKFAANKGLQDASLFLGECYETGNGVDKDYKIAEAYYRSIAVSGNHEGEYRLGKILFYLHNQYGAKDWLKKAAQAGHRDAANLLKYGK